MRGLDVHRWWRLGIACVAVLANIAACSGGPNTPDDGGVDATLPQGTEGGPCFPNGTCYAGLVCTLVGASGVCTVADAMTSDVIVDTTVSDSSVDVAEGGDAVVADVVDAGDANVSDATVVCDAGTNLQCQQTCSTTSISGKVYDPAGAIGLYNVFVYVPNAALSPITDGPVSAQCAAPATGSPIAWTTTAADGTFKLMNAPSGTNIPLVLQLGKWRRHLSVSTVTTCVDNPQSNGSLRLPKKQHETSQDDNVPLIALTTGCDSPECFLLQRIGIASSEFTDSNGTGRVHIYKSANDDGQTFPSPYNPTNAHDASYLWNTQGEMSKYDIVIDACECSTYSRGTSGYTNMQNYLNAGGRAFTTHYDYNFFASQSQCSSDTTCQGPSPFPTVASWLGNQAVPFATTCPTDAGISSPTCLTINTQNPRGKAFADWYKANNAVLATGGGEPYGYAGLTDVRADVGKLDAGLFEAGTATPWLYGGSVTSNYDSYYLSFNTPVGSNPSTQYGRAIFSDVHFGPAPFSQFPGYCPNNVNSDLHAPNQLALEFLFFDLASCIQDDTQQATTPPRQ